MAKVSTQIAAKDYPDQGIKKGDTYYSWTPGFRGRLQRSLTPPRQSQLTGNDKLSRVYSISEDIGDQAAKCDNLADLASLLETAASDLGDIIDEYRESFDNMPEGLQQGDVGQQLESNADELDGWKDELEEAAGEIEGLDFVEVANAERETEQGEAELPEDTKFEDLTDGDKEAVLEHARGLIPDCPL